MVAAGRRETGEARVVDWGLEVAVERAAAG